MTKENTLIKNTIIVTIGKICTQLVSFFLLPLYTALLSTEEYGVVDLLNTLVNLIVPIFIMQMDQGIFRFLIENRDKEEKKNQLITVTMYFMAVQIVLYTAFFFLASPWIHNEYKYFLLSNMIAALLSTVMLQISRGLGDNFRYSVGSFLAGSITVVLNVVFIAGMRLGAYGMLAASFAGNMACAVYLMIKLRIFQRIRKEYYSKQILIMLLKYSIPLVPNVISWWVITASNRIIISFFMNLSANGIYSAANKFSGVIVTLYSVFNLTWTESAAVNIDSEDRDSFFSKILEQVILIFGSVCLLVISFMPFVFPIMINEKFQEAYPQIPILMVATVFNILISYFGSVYVARKLTKEIAKTSVFAAGINIGINALLINYIGLFAASLGTAIAYFSMFLYRYLDSRKYVKLRIKKSIILSMIGMYLWTIVSYYINYDILNIITAIITFGYAFWLNRENAIVVLNVAKRKLKK